jgi:hypothetical protein
MKVLKFSFFVVSLTLNGENPLKPEDSKDAVPLIIHNANSIKVDTKRNPSDCTLCVGSEFKACMRAQTKEDFVANIRALHARACTAYVEQLTLNEMIEIRKLFTVEEWSALPRAFTQAMGEHFTVEREKAIDAWWERFGRIVNMWASLGALSD